MDNIDYSVGAIGQEKADGMFVNILIDKLGKVLLRSRNGNIIHQLEHLIKFLSNVPKKYWNTVYMGELLIKIDGKILPRKTGNGILNSCIQNTADQEMAKHAIIKLWDAVPYDQFFAHFCAIKYSFRLGRVSSFVMAMNNGHLLGRIQSKTLYSLEEAQSFYKQLRKNGKEGAVVKNKNATWKDHTSPNQIKMKNVSDAEMRVVSWKYGKEDTRFKDCVGSVQVESEDGLVKVSVSGLTDDERLEDWDSRIGKVCTMEFEGLITDKSKPGIWSMYLPRNIEMRPDRSYADTYKDLKER